MTNKMLPLLTIVILSACNNPSQNTPEQTNVKDSTITACYSSINDKDSIKLNITIKHNAVTGDLYYNLLEKDKNTGTIDGKMIGDTLIADYIFMSEGMQSVREVAFLKKGNSLVEGFGGVEDINGKTVFKNRSALVFNNANLLHKVDCSK